MKKLWLILAVLFFALPVWGQNNETVPPQCTVAQLSSGICAPSKLGTQIRITNSDVAVSDPNCAVGTGVNLILCVYDGTNWVGMEPGGGGGASTVYEATDCAVQVTTAVAGSLCADTNDNALYVCESPGPCSSTTSWSPYVSAGGLAAADIDTSAELDGIVTDDTGSGALVFATGPTLVAPNLGTPASGVATFLTGSATGLTAGNAINVNNDGVGATADLSGLMCGTGQILEDQGASWACITTPTTGSFSITGDDAGVNVTISNGNLLTFTGGTNGIDIEDGDAGADTLTFSFDPSEVGADAFTDAQIPNTITVSNYLPLVGGTLTGNLALSAGTGGLSGANLTDCDAANLKLQWSVENSKFTCGTDTGGTETNTLTTTTGGIADNQVPVGVLAGGSSAYATIPDCNGNFSLSFEQDTNLFSCEADDGAAGSGDDVLVGGTAVDDGINLIDGAAGVNIAFVDGAPDTATFSFVPGEVGADAFLDSQVQDIALTTGTSGNYVASIATTAPISGGAAGSEGGTLTLTTSMATNRLIGRTTASTGVMQEITVNAPLTLATQILDITAIADADLASSYSGIGTCSVISGNANTWVNALADNGAPTCLQPNFTNIAGTTTNAQTSDALSHLTGDISLEALTVTGILSGEIPIGQLAGNLIAYTTLNGDVTLTDTGLTTVQDNSVDGTDISIGTTNGDILYYNGTDWVRLAKGTSGQVLESTAGAPAWATDDGGAADVASITDTGNICSANQVIARNAGDTAFACTAPGGSGEFSTLLDGGNLCASGQVVVRDGSDTGFTCAAGGTGVTAIGDCTGPACFNSTASSTTLTFSGDAADTGAIRIPFGQGLCWEGDVGSTELCITSVATNSIQIGAGISQINMGASTEFQATTRYSGDNLGIIFDDNAAADGTPETFFQDYTSTDDNGSFAFGVESGSPSYVAPIAIQSVAGATSVYLGGNAAIGTTPTNAIVVSEAGIASPIGSGSIIGSDDRCIDLVADEITCFGSAGCSGETIDATGHSFVTANFIDGTDRTGSFTFNVPKGFTGVASTVEIDWVSNNSACDGIGGDTVCWAVDSGSVAGGSPFITPTLAGTLKGATSTCTGDGLMVRTQIATYTHGMVDGERGILTLTRDTDDTAADCTTDTYTQAAKVIAVRLCRNQ